MPTTSGIAPWVIQVEQSKCSDDLILTPQSLGLFWIAVCRCFRHAIESQSAIALTAKAADSRGFPAGLWAARGWKSRSLRVLSRQSGCADINPARTYSMPDDSLAQGSVVQAGEVERGGWKTSSDRRVGRTRPSLLRGRTYPSRPHPAPTPHQAQELRRPSSNPAGTAGAAGCPEHSGEKQGGGVTGAGIPSCSPARARGASVRSATRAALDRSGTRQGASNRPVCCEV